MFKEADERERSSFIITAFKGAILFLLGILVFGLTMYLEWLIFVGVSSAIGGSDIMRIIGPYGPSSQVSLFVLVASIPIAICVTIIVVRTIGGRFF